MVSVVIPNYNRGKLVRRAIFSVLRQTYKDLEVIVVDDASTDDSVKVINSISDCRLHLIRLDQNSGACVARNEGIKVATGDYITFLDSDDVWKPNNIEKNIKYISLKNCDVVVSSYEFIGMDGKHSKKPIYSINSRTGIFSQLLERNFVTTGTIFAKKECFQNCLFDSNLPRYQDWDISLQLAKRYNISYVDEVTLYMYEQKNSITNSTSYEKKYKALEYIYNKYIDSFNDNINAKIRILWSAGLYSLFTENPRIDYLRFSTDNSKDIYKKIILFVVLLGGRRIITWLYARKH